MVQVCGVAPLALRTLSNRGNAGSKRGQAGQSWATLGHAGQSWAKFDGGNEQLVVDGRAEGAASPFPPVFCGGEIGDYLTSVSVREETEVRDHSFTYISAPSPHLPFQ